MHRDGRVTIVSRRKGIILRPEEEADVAFSRALFHADRAPMFMAAGWPSASLAATLESQFALQDTHFRRAFASADRWIVTAAGQDVGRLIVDRTGPRWRLVDILLAPDAQGTGIGTALIEWLLKDARGSGARALALSVAIDNVRAEALYRRLGFVDAISVSASHRELVRSVS